MINTPKYIPLSIKIPNYLDGDNIPNEPFLRTSEKFKDLYRTSLEQDGAFGMNARIHLNQDHPLVIGAIHLKELERDVANKHVVDFAELHSRLASIRVEFHKALTDEADDSDQFVFIDPVDFKIQVIIISRKPPQNATEQELVTIARFKERALAGIASREELIHLFSLIQFTN